MSVIKFFGTNKAQIIKEYEDGLLTNAIAERLTREGYTTISGKPISSSYISRFAHDYGCAKRHYRAKKKKKAIKLKSELAPSTVKTVTVPANYAENKDQTTVNASKFDSLAIADLLLSNHLSDSAKQEFLRWKLSSI